jgi:uncharacterized protein DUF4105
MRTSESDPFEPQAILRSGPFAGRRLDVAHFRSVRLLTRQEADAYECQPGERLAVNFMHQDDWHIARIPEAPVDDVIVHVEHVANSFPGAHSQIRLRLVPGREVTLLRKESEADREPARIADLIYTVDGNFAPGTSFSSGGGFEQSGIAYMLMSLQQKVKIMEVDGRLPVIHQYRLNISTAAKQKVLERALELATRAESGKMFNLLRRNCTTEAIKVLDGAVHYPTWRRLLARLTYDGLPEAMRLYLRERGLLGADSHLQDLANDLSWER